jgi:hypothetical protein
MAYYGVITPANRRQSERVGGGSGKNEKHIAIRLKQITNETTSLSGPLILAITGSVAMVGLLQRGPSLGADARIVVTGEMARAFHRRVVREALIFAEQMLP